MTMVMMTMMMMTFTVTATKAMETIGESSHATTTQMTTSDAPRRALKQLPFASRSGTSAPEHRHHMSTGVSRELIERIAVDGAIIVTWANNHYFDFAMNFVEHLEKLGVKNYIVGAMDEDLYEALRKININTWLMGSKTIDAGSVKKDFGWGTPTFHKMGRDKIRLINDFTKSGVDVLISDIDVAWMRNPIPFFRRYPTADILVSSDNLSNSTHISPRQANFRVDDEGLQENPCGGTANIGMMWFRSTAGSQALTDEWVLNLEKDPKLWDQAEFNTLMRRGGCWASPDGSGVGPGYGGKVQLGALPVALFNNGHTFFTQRLPEHLGLNPYALHATFQYEGTPGKRNRIREANQWLSDRDIPDYFAPKFMSYTPRVLSDVNLEQFKALGYPAAATGRLPPLTEGQPVLKEHMRMVQHQIAQLYEANAIAKKLGRVLILPAFFCGLDRVWFPHGGIFPGSMLRLPFICPADHIMAMESYGAKFMQEYREFSFLSNPSMPSGVVTQSNVRRVAVPANGSFLKTNEIKAEYPMCFKTPETNPEDGDKCAPARNKDFLNAESVSLGSAPKASLDDVAFALMSVAHVKFLHFDTIIGVTVSSQAKTTEQLRMGIFCCRLGSHDFYSVNDVNLFEVATAEQSALVGTNEHASMRGMSTPNQTAAMMMLPTPSMTTPTTMDSTVTLSETGTAATVRAGKPERRDIDEEDEKREEEEEDDDDEEEREEEEKATKKKTKQIREKLLGDYDDDDDDDAAVI